MFYGKMRRKFDIFTLFFLNNRKNINDKFTTIILQGYSDRYDKSPTN